jgi:hypothetical protein
MNTKPTQNNGRIRWGERFSEEAFLRLEYVLEGFWGVDWVRQAARHNWAAIEIWAQDDKKLTQLVSSSGRHLGGERRVSAFPFLRTIWPFWIPPAMAGGQRRAPQASRSNYCFLRPSSQDLAHHFRGLTDLV